MNQFRKKPVVIHAIQWDGSPEVLKELSARAPDGFRVVGEWAIIKTLEGEMRAERGDWIIQGVKGELYPCKPDIFEKTYDALAGGDNNARILDTREIWGELAGRLWTTYRASCGAKSFKGDPLPTWTEMLEDDSKKDIVKHWLATAAEAYAAVVDEWSDPQQISASGEVP